MKRSPGSDGASPHHASLVSPDDQRITVPLYRQQVGDAEKAEHIVVDRALVNFFRRADLANLSLLVHDRDAVGDAERDLLVVRDVKDRHAELLLQRFDFEAHFLAQVGVEVVQRFVEQQDARFMDQRPGQRDALLLATGKLRRLAVPRASSGRPFRSPRACAVCSVALSTPAIFSG